MISHAVTTFDFARFANRLVGLVVGDEELRDKVMGVGVGNDVGLFVGFDVIGAADVGA
jgi:hypothetical protein